MDDGVVRPPRPAIDLCWLLYSSIRAFFIEEQKAQNIGDNNLSRFCLSPPPPSSCAGWTRLEWRLQPRRR